MFFRIPVERGLTTKVTVADRSRTSVPISQFSSVCSLQEPCVELAETKSTPAGRVSKRYVSVAVSGPLFFTSMV
jgi:hypothetical protein